jgi:hypothetical protein
LPSAGLFALKSWLIDRQIPYLPSCSGTGAQRFLLLYYLSVVHCAAQKYPDKLDADYERSVALNVASTDWLALATKEVK